MTPTIARLCALSGMALMLVATTVGCGRVEPTPTGAHGGTAALRPSTSASPDDTAPPDEPVSPEPNVPAPLSPAPVIPVPSAPVQPGATASPCAGRPSEQQITAALRRRDPNLLPAGSTPRAVTGPMCAGSWQYTVLVVPDRDPLQVVTRGSGDSLTVVTAGTYVCTPEVTGTAPPGIVSAARCR